VLITLSFNNSSNNKKTQAYNIYKFINLRDLISGLACFIVFATHRAVFKRVKGEDNLGEIFKNRAYKLKI